MIKSTIRKTRRHNLPSPPKPVTSAAEVSDDNAKQQAKAQLESIIELVKNWNDAGDKENDDLQEQAERAICEDALSVEVRSSWQCLGEKFEADEFRILLCTGGPAVQIVGDLGKYGEPESVELQYQDWFTPWTNYHLTQEEFDTVLTYVRRFYFGEA